MTQMNPQEKQIPVRNLERIEERVGFLSYEDAAKVKAGKSPELAVKTKIIARSNGTYDVVWYKKLVAEEPKAVEKDEDKKVHGQKSKDRRRRDRKESK